MKLEAGRRVRRLRAAEIINGPEQAEEFDAKKIIGRVIAIANERFGWVSRLRISPESVLLVQAAYPDMLAQLIPKPLEASFRRQPAGDPLEDATLLEASIGSNKYQWKDGQLETLFKSISNHLREYTGAPESPVRLMKSTVYLARLFPEKRQELAQLVRRINPEILSMLDNDALDPSYQRPTIAGMLRLLDPSARLSLQDVVEPHLEAWKEELDRWLSPEMVSKYSSRGLQHYLDQALQAAAGIEILSAQEAYISDNGELVVVSSHPLVQPSQPLPERPLT